MTIRNAIKKKWPKVKLKIDFTTPTAESHLLTVLIRKFAGNKLYDLAKK